MYANYPFPGMVLIQQYLNLPLEIRPEIQIDGSGFRAGRLRARLLLVDHWTDPTHSQSLLRR